jgi:hypothetical protein
MTTTAGFYKFDGEVLRFAAGSVYAPNFTLLLELRETYTYPVNGWRYFATTEQAESFFEINGQTQADWQGFQTALLQSAEFAAARIQAQQIIQSELRTAEGTRQQRLLRAATALNDIGAIVLAAGEQNNPTMFIGAWLILRQANLVSVDVATGMEQIAIACNLPADLIDSLGAPDQPA